MKETDRLFSLVFGENLLTSQHFPNPQRLRTYRLFYRKDTYSWKGPPLRQLLKLLCPLQKLNMDANDMYLQSRDEAETPQHLSYFLLISMHLSFFFA